MKTRNYFNLIEILISFIVIVFSLFVLLSLFPLSIKQTDEASKLNYVAGLTESLSAYIKTLPLDEAGELSLSDFPAPSSALADAKPKADTSKLIYPEFTDESAYNAADEVAFQTVILNPKNASARGYFLLSSYEIIDGVRVKLSEVEARIWHSNVAASNSATAPAGTNLVANASFSDNALEPSSLDGLKFPLVSRVNVEFSWPLNKAYDDRQKKYFFLTLNRLTEKGGYLR